MEILKTGQRNDNENNITIDKTGGSMKAKYSRLYYRYELNNDVYQEISELSRTVSIQLAPQIRLLQNADQEVVDRLASDIINTIPLWRNQMVLALGIEHTRKALDAQSAVNEMTNELLRKNAETLKMGAIDAAKASESGIVDIETLRKCNDDIISSINEVVKIHEEGSRKRAEAEVEIVRIEEELKQALLAACNR
jgi:uncharacterized protein YaaN involved in tellurite resistance